MPAEVPSSHQVLPSGEVLPSDEDGFVRGLSELGGGPAGRHARPSPPRRALAVVLLLTAVTCLLGWVQKSPCRTHPWTHEYQYTRMCYSDTFALYYAEKLADGKTPYVDTPVEYPVLLGAAMGVTAKVVAWTPVGGRGQRYFDLNALLLTAAAMVVAAMTWALAGRRRPWDAALFAAAPVLVFNAFTNWDLIAAALAAAGLWAWARRRPILAGVLVGIGTATKLYPALLLLPLLALCLRERQLREWFRAAAAAVIAWLIIDVPVWLTYPRNFGRFWSLNRNRGADWNSIWLALEHARGRPLDPAGAVPPDRLNLAFAAATLLVILGVIALALLAPRRPRVASLAFLLVAGFLLVNKVASPQYVLWVLPLAVLARPRWGALLAWQATEIVTLFFLYYYFVANAHPGSGIAVEWYLTALLVRDAALIGLMALVGWEIWQPDRDVVRRSGVDDPAGGVLVRATG
ncbi:MAG: glycosyltransferase 87 family protein [Frankiaceae bacterium]